MCKKESKNAVKSRVKMCITALATAIVCALCLCACFGRDSGEDSLPPTKYFYLHETVSTVGSDGYITATECETRVDVKSNNIDGERNFGYALVGVFSQPGGVGTMYYDEYGDLVNGVEIAEGEHAYAQYTPRKYTIRLDADGATFRDIEVSYGATLSFFDVPEGKTGYDFDGWWQKRDGGYVNKVADADGRIADDKRVFDGSRYLFPASGDNRVTIYMRFVPKKYDITYNYNGVKDNVTVKADYDSTLDPPQVDAVPGYEFIGWSYENTTEDYRLYDGEKVTGELTLYAIYKRYKDFDIINIDSGEKIDDVRVYENSQVVLAELTVNVPNGYEVLHWYRNESGGGAAITVLSYADAGNAVYVELGAIRYTIELIAGDGVTVSGGITRLEYTCEQSVALPAATREHCEFKGWCRDKNLSTSPITRIAIGTTGDLKLYPYFKGEDVTFELDAQNGDAAKTAVREYGKSYTLDVPTRTGYTFIGWFDAADGGAQYTYENGKSVNALDTVERLKLFAQWEINRYSVRYVDANGETLYSQVYEHGDVLELPKDEPQSGKLTFSGWYDGNDYKTQVTGGTKVTSDMTVYALFLDSKPVRTAEDLCAIADDPDGNYHLLNDINLGSEAWTPIDVFGGTLDGKGYKIHNFALSLTQTQPNFGFINVNNGTVKNLAFENFSYSVVSNVTGETDCGIVVGRNNGSIVNCRVVNDTACRLTVVTETYNSTISKSFYFGGIVGCNVDTFSDSYVNIKVESSITSKCHHIKGGQSWETIYSKFYTFFGGACGQNVGGTVERCVAEVDFNSTTTLYSENDYAAYAESENYLYVGGICGSNRDNSVIRFSQSKIKIVNNYATQGSYGAGYGSASRNSYNYAIMFGGLLGENHSILESCYAESDISAKSMWNSSIKGGDTVSSGVGGVVGINWASGNIRNCFAAANMNVLGGSNADTGGFIGINWGNVLNCYSTGSVAADDNSGRSIGGFCGVSSMVGTISGCISMADVTVRVGPAGRFIAGNYGTVRQSYFSSNVKMQINGSISTADNCNDASEKSESELVSREFLVNSLYWDDTIWTIDGSNRPVLMWQA